MPLVIRQYKETDFRFRILGLDKRAFDRCAIRPFHDAGKCRAIAGCRKEKRKACKSQDFCSGPHVPSKFCPEFVTSNIEMVIDIMPHKLGEWVLRQLVRGSFRGSGRTATRRGGAVPVSLSGAKADSQEWLSHKAIGPRRSIRLSRGPGNPVGVGANRQSAGD